MLFDSVWLLELLLRISWCSWIVPPLLEGQVCVEDIGIGMSVWGFRNNMITDHSLPHVSIVTVICESVKTCYKLFYRLVVLPATLDKMSTFENQIFPHSKESIKFLVDLIIVSTFVLYWIYRGQGIFSIFSHAI